MGGEMDRRQFLGVLVGGTAAAAGVLACDAADAPLDPPAGAGGAADGDEPGGGEGGGGQEPTPDAGGGGGDAEPVVDASEPAPDAATVIMYDTYAIALYYDGTHGPRTGVIQVAYILANQPVDLEFWHGHGFPEQHHRYTVTPAHFAQLKLGKRVTVETTYVDSHNHTLFIDPVDPKYRVPGAMPTPVPV